MLLVSQRIADAHPMHTTLTEITADTPRGALHVVIRVFADDFGKASALAKRNAQGTTPSAGDALAYVQRSFVLTDGRRLLPIRSCGTQQKGDLLWICVETDAPQSLGNLQLRNALLCELFDDQVNIVRSMLGGSPRSLLYTRGDHSKPLL